MALQMTDINAVTGLSVTDAHIRIEKVTLTRAGMKVSLGWRTNVSLQPYRFTDHADLVYNKSDTLKNLQTQIYEQLKLLPEFSTAIDI